MFSVGTDVSQNCRTVCSKWFDWTTAGVIWRFHGIEAMGNGKLSEKFRFSRWDRKNGRSLLIVIENLLVLYLENTFLPFKKYLCQWDVGGNDSAGGG